MINWRRLSPAQAICKNPPPTPLGGAVAPAALVADRDRTIMPETTSPPWAGPREEGTAAVDAVLPDRGPVQLLLLEGVALVHGQDSLIYMQPASSAKRPMSSHGTANSSGESSVRVSPGEIYINPESLSNIANSMIQAADCLTGTAPEITPLAAQHSIGLLADSLGRWQTASALRDAHNIAAQAVSELYDHLIYLMREAARFTAQTARNYQDAIDRTFTVVTRIADDGNPIQHGMAAFGDFDPPRVLMSRPHVYDESTNDVVVSVPRPSLDEDSARYEFHQIAAWLNSSNPNVIDHVAGRWRMMAIVFDGLQQDLQAITRDAAISWSSPSYEKWRRVVLLIASNAGDLNGNVQKIADALALASSGLGYNRGFAELNEVAVAFRFGPASVSETQAMRAILHDINVKYAEAIRTMPSQVSGSFPFFGDEAARSRMAAFRPTQVRSHSAVMVRASDQGGSGGVHDQRPAEIAPGQAAGSVPDGASGTSSTWWPVTTFGNGLIDAVPESDSGTSLASAPSESDGASQWASGSAVPSRDSLSRPGGGVSSPQDVRIGSGNLLPRPASRRNAVPTHAAEKSPDQATERIREYWLPEDTDTWYGGAIMTNPLAGGDENSQAGATKDEQAAAAHVQAAVIVGGTHFHGSAKVEGDVVGGNKISTSDPVESRGGRQRH